MEQITVPKEEANALRLLRKYGLSLTPKRAYMLKVIEDVHKSDEQVVELVVVSKI